LPVLNPPTEKVEASPDAILYGCSGCINISIKDFKGTSRRDGKLAGRVKLLCA